MTIPVLFVQGAGEGTHDAWDHKLVESLAGALGPGYDIRYPRMPDEGAPRYAAWKAVLAGELAALGNGAVLVGHSAGATMLLHLLAEQRGVPRPIAVALIAPPFIGEGGWPSDEMPARTDFAAGLPAAVFLYHGTEDTIVPFEHMTLYAQAIPQAVIRRLADRGHQLNNDLSAVARDILSLKP